MAMTVSASVQIIDMMSNPIQHITSALNIMIDCMEKTNKAVNVGFDSSAIYKMRQHIDTANMELTETAEKIENIRNKTSKAENVQKSYTNSLSQAASNATQLGNNLVNGIRKYATIAASMYGGKQLLNLGDIWTSGKARLGLIANNDSETNELERLLYNSATSSRGSYTDILNNAAKLGLLAGDAFGSNNEIVMFSELMNKSFKISGAGTQESTAGMYQLTQAMAAGKLQGDEFRSIMENAPMLAQAIADYTGKTKGELKEMSSEGTITADIIKNALFSAADDIENKFSTLPMTFSETWISAANSATMAFAPVYEQLNNMLNSDVVQKLISGLPELFENISSSVQRLLYSFENIWITLSPGLSNLVNSIGNIGNALFNTNGVLINFARTLGNTLVNPGVTNAINNIVGGLIIAANAFNNVLKIATPLLPQITGIYVAFKAYKTISTFLTPVANGLSSIISMTNTMTNAMRNATAAQDALNAAMTANPYGLVANAVVGVISVMLSLIATIKAVNTAAGLVNNSEYSYDNVARINQIMESNGVDRNTASQLLSDWESYQQSLDDSSKNREAAYDNWFNNKANKWKITRAGQVSGLNGDALRNYMIENSLDSSELGKIRNTYAENEEALFNTWRAQNQSVLESYRQSVNTANTLSNISTDINDYMYDYGDLVDIDSDIAKNTKDMADNTEKTYNLIEMVKDNWEKKLLSEYTSKASVITYDLSGMQNTYNDVGPDFNPIREIEKYLKKKEAISTEGV